MNDQEFEQWLERAFQAPPDSEPDHTAPTARVLHRLKGQRRLRLIALTAAALTGAAGAALLFHRLLPADVAATAARDLHALVQELPAAGPGSLLPLSGVLLALAALRVIRKV